MYEDATAGHRSIMEYYALIVLVFVFVFVIHIIIIIIIIIINNCCCCCCGRRSGPELTKAARVPPAQQPTAQSIA